jgi:hypothetical protein
MDIVRRGKIVKPVLESARGPKAELQAAMMSAMTSA